MTLNKLIIIFAVIMFGVSFLTLQWIFKPISNFDNAVLQKQRQQFVTNFKLQNELCFKKPSWSYLDCNAITPHNNPTRFICQYEGCKFY